MSEVKRGEYVYRTLNMYWVFVPSFNFHSLMKKFYYFHVPQEGRGGRGVATCHGHPSTNRNQVCLNQSPPLSTVT